MVEKNQIKCNHNKCNTCHVSIDRGKYFNKTMTTIQVALNVLKKMVQCFDSMRGLIILTKGGEREKHSLLNNKREMFMSL